MFSSVANCLFFLIFLDWWNKCHSCSQSHSSPCASPLMRRPGQQITESTHSHQWARQSTQRSLKEKEWKYIYIYAFSRRFYPSDLQLHPGYTFSLVCVFPGNRTHNPLRHWRNALRLSHTGKYIVSSYSKHTGSPLIPPHNDFCSIHQLLDLSTHANIDSVYTRVPQIFPWRANLLQSLAPTLFKLTYLWFSNDLEDSD